MSVWSGANVVVTGAASGIGLALSTAMIARGANVWLTDVDAAAAQDAAGKLGAKAHWAELDVRDASAVREVVERVVSEQGSLDYLFNNAGIGVGGESHEVGTDLYDRIIDINIRGVTNGVAAAYPIMVKQGRGHIVNTASLAGLLPIPLLAAYAMTKHAVVGLSSSLRLEAERYGVKISALCPGAIDTPLLDTTGPSDLPQMWMPDIRRYLTRIAGAPYPVSKLAETALRGVERNLDRIILPATGRAGSVLNRVLPSVIRFQTRRALRAERAERPPPY